MSHLNTILSKISIIFNLNGINEQIKVTGLMKKHNDTSSNSAEL